MKTNRAILASVMFFLLVAVSVSCLSAPVANSGEATVACPKCQNANPVDAKFCNECGARLPQPGDKDPATVACPKCQNANPVGAKFCNVCGAGLPQSKTEKEPEPQAAFCTKCGAKLAPGAAFCTKCGARARSTSTDTARTASPSLAQDVAANKAYLVADHTSLDISKIDLKNLGAAKSGFRIWYGHTSHGSQITSGMAAMNNPPFDYNRGAGSLSYRETNGDLGHNGDLRWAERTRAQLNRGDNDRNVVMWSWCGGVSNNTEDGINAYLNAMNELESDFPGVIFIYMTGHLDGGGENGNLHKRNEQIRAYCRKNGKVLFDFADIESYDPDGNYFLDKRATDSCNYRDGNSHKNWAAEWIDRHPRHGWDLPGRAAHTHPLNGAMKGRAFWSLLAKLAARGGK